MTFTDYLKAKGLFSDYEAIKRNLEEYESDIASLDFEKQPNLLSEMRFEIKSCREALALYYDEYRKEWTE